MESDAYAALAALGGNRSALGSAFISLVEPHPGHEHAYNRWYEDDHYYSSGAMAMPWWFAGRRWVATRELRDLRLPSESPVAVPVTTGCYLGTYWITAEHWDDQWSWLGVAVSRLREAGRMFEERTHVHTAFYDFIGEVRRGDDGPRGFQALNHPYAGLVLEILDVHDGSIDSAVDWVTREHVPAVLRGSPMGLCTVFAPHPWPAGQYWFENAAVPAGRLALLWFLDEDPRESWADTFAVEPARVGGTGIATMSFLAPFIPTIPGTDRYVDELR